MGAIEPELQGSEALKQLPSGSISQRCMPCQTCACLRLLLSACRGCAGAKGRWQPAVQDAHWQALRSAIAVCAVACPNGSCWMGCSPAGTTLRCAASWFCWFSRSYSLCPLLARWTVCITCVVHAPLPLQSVCTILRWPMSLISCLLTGLQGSSQEVTVSSQTRSQLLCSCENQDMHDYTIWGHGSQADDRCSLGAPQASAGQGCQTEAATRRNVLDTLYRAMNCCQWIHSLRRMHCW